VARQILQAQAMADFGVAAEGSGAAAGNIGQHKVKGRFFVERGRVGETAFHPASAGGKAFA